MQTAGAEGQSFELLQLEPYFHIQLWFKSWLEKLEQF